MASKKKPAKKRVLPKQKARRPVVKKAAPKAKKINPIPTGMHAITPSLVFKDAEAALKFYRAAFGAKELYRLTEPGGKIGHAEMGKNESALDEVRILAFMAALLDA